MISQTSSLYYYLVIDNNMKKALIFLIMTIMMVAITTTISQTQEIYAEIRLKTYVHSMMENGTMVNVNKK